MFPYPRFDGDWMVWAGVATPDRQAANRRSVSAPHTERYSRERIWRTIKSTTLFDSDTLGEVGSLLYSKQILMRNWLAFGSDDAVRVRYADAGVGDDICRLVRPTNLVFSRLSDDRDDVIVGRVNNLFTNELTGICGS